MNYNEKIEHWIRGWDDEEPEKDENSKLKEDWRDYVINSEEE